MQVPTLALKFESARELKLPEKNYLIRWMAGTYCLAFDGTSGALSSIWNVQHHVTTNLSREPEHRGRQRSHKITASMHWHVRQSRRYRLTLNHLARVRK
jgi:hypothetical protein